MQEVFLFFLKALPRFAIFRLATAKAKLIGALPLLKKGEQIAERGLRNSGKRLSGKESLVRGNDDIGHRDQTGEQIVL